MTRFVTIICPYRNAASFLPGLVANVLQQTYAHWELLLIDDASTDCGLEYARASACTDARIRALVAPRRPLGTSDGPWWPRNHGLANASHDLIAFLDADDRWHPSKLERQVVAHSNGFAQISVTGYARFDPYADLLLSCRLPPARFGYRRLLRSNVIPMLTAIVDRSLLTDGFQPCSHEDYLLWLTIFRDNPGLQCYCLPELLGFYAVHSGNLTHQRWQMPLWTFRVFRAHGMSILNCLLCLALWSTTQLLDQLSRLRSHPLPSFNDALVRQPPWCFPLSSSHEDSC